MREPRQVSMATFSATRIQSYSGPPDERDDPVVEHLLADGDDQRLDKYRMSLRELERCGECNHGLSRGDDVVFIFDFQEMVYDTALHFNCIQESDWVHRLKARETDYFLVPPGQGSNEVTSRSFWDDVTQ